MADPATQKIERFRPRTPCPECGGNSSRRHYPFCSSRCKNLDLNRWLSGHYVIPGKPDADEDNHA